MARSKPGRDITKGALLFLAACAGLIVLIQAGNFLVPIVIAILIAELLSWAVDRLKSFGIASWLAKLTAIAVVLAVNAAFVWVLYDQLLAISQTWSKYAARLQAVDEQVRALLGAELASSVESAVSRVDIGALAGRLAESTSSALGAFALVILYSAFLLGERGQLPEKLGRLVTDSERKARLTVVLDRMNTGVRRYLGIKTVVSALTGSLCYAILKYYGVDFAEFWGILIFLLNFIPSIGSFVAVVLPSILTLLQFDTIWVFVQVAALMSLVQFVIGNIVEPRYMGASLNLSAFVVIVALTFWGTVWGIPGMFLSVPFTATLVIVCSHVPRLRWISILLSSDGRIGEQAGTSPGSSNGGKSRGRFSIFGRPSRGDPDIEALRRDLDALKQELADRKA